MPKVLGRNKHQKAAHKPGEPQVSRETISELLTMACSADPEERLFAAELLCPCHIKGRIAEVWDALYRMMEDDDWRVRRAAWHTLEDGGLPKDEAAFARLETLYNRERDSKVRKFAHSILGKELEARKAREKALLYLQARPAVRKRGKCDFCGATEVFVDYQLDTLIPTNGLPRAALICDRCTETV